VGNNYGRADGQNVGNFMTGRSSSRVLAPPGGGSSFSFGNDGSENAQRGSGGGNAQHSVGTRFF
jgi:SPIRAL1-like protein